MARTPRTARGRASQTARRTTRQVALAFDALWVEGALIAPAQLARIASLDAGPDQTPADYGLRKGVQFRDELPLAFASGVQWFAEFSAAPGPSETATLAFTQGLLRDVFGFTDLEPREDISFAALGGRVPVVVVPPGQKLDGYSPTLSARLGKRTSATLALQDWLNAQDGALWGIACNGEKLRLLRDNPSLTRPAYIEADLRRIFESSALADFSALWLLIHASRFGKPGTAATECSLERWRDSGQKAGEAARERLRDGVEAALAQLGDGFLRHPANTALRERLTSGAVSLPDFFNQLLRLVYRLIFLLAAEDRGLLHPRDAAVAARDLYAQGYSVGRLRERAVRPASWDAHDDLWDGLGILFQALARGEPRLGLPALDGLFAPGGTPELDDAALSNKALLRAMRGLAWLEGTGAPVPVNWRDMETEELGSVYESLLELAPILIEGGRGFAFAAGEETRGNQRKTTGSYYTPDSLVQALLSSALDPVLDRAQAEAADPVAALLDTKVLDPACGSGHFLLAAGRHIAARVARLRSGGTPNAEEYRHALREVASSCLHGVDRNPMAVELAKVALWVETVEPGKPLGFLDANLRYGDSLLGIFDFEALRKGIPDDAFKPLTGDNKAACRGLLLRNRAERGGQGSLNLGGVKGSMPPVAPIVEAAASWRALPEDSSEQIHAKRARFEAARDARDAYTLQVACDLYTAAFLASKPTGSEATAATCLVPTTAAIWQRMAGRQIYPPMEAHAVDLSRSAAAFHWPLEFPDIFARGGFDAILGNPPWDRIKLQEKEYFALRAPEIALAANAAERGAMILELRDAPLGTRKRALFDAFEQAKRSADAGTVFARVAGDDGGRFPLAGRGDVNTYSLFSELAACSINANGAAGIIVPTGISTDATTAVFFGSLVEKARLRSLYSFREIRHWFTATDDRNPFCLLTIGRAPEGARFGFYLRHPDDIGRLRFSLSPAQIAAMNPNTKTAPLFRTKVDADLTSRIYARMPILVDLAAGADGNPWGVSFAAMFHMANDSGLFNTAAQLQRAGLIRDGANWIEHAGLSPTQGLLAIAGGRDRSSLPLDGGPAQRQRYVPLYEAKMIHQFDHRWATYEGTDVRDSTSVEKRDPTFEPTPKYWLNERDVRAAIPEPLRTRGWLMGWRDICRATDERTLIAGIIPAVGCGHKFLLLFSNRPAPLCAALYASLNSLVCDYVVRQKLGGTSFTYFTMRQIAVLPPSTYTEDALAFIVPRVLELTYTSHALRPFAQDIGYDGPPFGWDEARRAQLRAELDAWYARAYGLTRDELRYLLDPADVHGSGYPSETFRVLKENETRRYGEYRTARLVLEAWDRLAEDG